MAKREGFVDIHHDKTRQVGYVPEETFAVYEELGWKKGHKEYTTTAAADEKKG